MKRQTTISTDDHDEASRRCEHRRRRRPRGSNGVMLQKTRGDDSRRDTLVITIAHRKWQSTTRMTTSTTTTSADESSGASCFRTATLPAARRLARPPPSLASRGVTASGRESGRSKTPPTTDRPPLPASSTRHDDDRGRSRAACRCAWPSRRPISSLGRARAVQQRALATTRSTQVASVRARRSFARTAVRLSDGRAPALHRPSRSHALSRLTTRSATSRRPPVLTRHSNERLA